MTSVGTPLLWSLFAAFVVLAVAVDFFALNKQGAHKVSMREALVWSLIWVAVSAAFAGWIWWYLGASPDEAMRALANATSSISPTCPTGKTRFSWQKSCGIRSKVCGVTR